MSYPAAPSTLASVRQLAAQPCVLWAGLLSRTTSNLLSFNPEGNLRPSNPTESVLIDAILTASAALADRLGLETPTDFDHRSPSGGMLLHSPDPSRCLILCHGPAAPIPLLRLALRDCARHLPPPNPHQTHMGQPTEPIWSDAPTEPNLTAAGQSEVYNPFTSA